MRQIGFLKKIFTEEPSEAIQKLNIGLYNIENKNINAKNQPFSSTNIPENINASLEASPIENMDIIILSQPMENNLNETTETYFNCTLLDDGTIFSSHTVNTPSIIGLDNNCGTRVNLQQTLCLLHCV